MTGFIHAGNYFSNHLESTVLVRSIHWVGITVQCNELLESSCVTGLIYAGRYILNPLERTVLVRSNH